MDLPSVHDSILLYNLQCAFVNCILVSCFVEDRTGNNRKQAIAWFSIAIAHLLHSILHRFGWITGY